MSKKKNSKDPLLYIDRDFMELMNDLVKIDKKELVENHPRSKKN